MRIKPGVCGEGVPTFNSAGAARLVDHLDAHLFTGDTFHDANDAHALQWFLARWQTRLDEISADKAEGHDD